LTWNEVVWSGKFVADERLGFELWEAPGVSEPVRLRDQFTGSKRPKDSDRPQPESQNKTQNIAMKTPKITAYLKPTCGWSEGVRAILGKSQSALRRSRYHQQSVQLD
jgi:hypothetical protein